MDTRTGKIITEEQANELNKKEPGRAIPLADFANVTHSLEFERARMTGSALTKEQLEFIKSLRHK